MKIPARIRNPSPTLYGTESIWGKDMETIKKSNGMPTPLTVPVSQPHGLGALKMPLADNTVSEYLQPRTSAQGVCVTGATSAQGEGREKQRRLTSLGCRPLKLCGYLALVFVVVQAIWMPVPLLDTVDAPWRYDQLWSDGLLKQISGYSMVAFVFCGLLLSLRRRIKRFQLGRYATWRYSHAIFGVLGVFMLAVHSGLRLGHNVNFLLASCYLAIVLSGSITALFLTSPIVVTRSLGERLRRALVWMHILLIWPFPILLTFHIVAGYYF